MSPENSFRKFNVRLAADKNWQTFVILAIVVSTGALMYSDPFTKEKTWVFWTDWITACIFVFEAANKIIAYGFVMNGPESYLRHFANSFDFIIVVAAIYSQLQAT